MQILYKKKAEYHENLYNDIEFFSSEIKNLLRT